MENIEFLLFIWSMLSPKQREDFERNFEIYKSQESYKEISEKYNLSYTRVYKIKHPKYLQHETLNYSQILFEYKSGIV